MFKSTSTSLILLDVLAIIVGIIALAWPGVTVLALVILGGLVSIAFGVVIFARPNVGAATLALFGLFSLIYGVSLITTGVELRRAGQTLDKSWTMRPEPAPGVRPGRQGGER
jgi:uncharacterized membrane protein HdeD (DUF308 family)